jgi:hypothetical protein
VSVTVVAGIAITAIGAAVATARVTVVLSTASLVRVTRAIRAARTPFLNAVAVIAAKEMIRTAAIKAYIQH